MKNGAPQQLLTLPPLFDADHDSSMGRHHEAMLPAICRQKQARNCFSQLLTSLLILFAGFMLLWRHSFSVSDQSVSQKWQIPDFCFVSMF
ncbi:MAG: hypothetical protein VKI63_06495 [Cyanobium sp.]|nr:hypothetical protein [Cyanobium sp.]